MNKKMRCCGRKKPFSSEHTQQGICNNGVLKSGAACAAQANLGKMTAWIIQLQGKGCRLNGAAFLQPLSGIPALPARNQLGNLSCIICSLQNGFRAWIGQVEESAPSQLQQLLALVLSWFKVSSGEVTLQDWGCLSLQLDYINRGECQISHPQLKQYPPGWPLEKGHSGV